MYEVLTLQQISHVSPLDLILWRNMLIQRSLTSLTFNSNFKSWSGRAAVPGGNTILFL